MNTLGTVSLAQLKRAITIREQIESLEAELSQILGTETPPPTPTPATPKKWTMSASARAKIGAAQKARWAERKGTPVKGRRKMSAAARAAISAAAKARWQKVKAAEKSSL